MEVIIASIVATVAVLGLAYTFGMGRSFIDRFEIARLALSTAQARMEQLAVTPSSDASLALGSHPVSPLPFAWQGQTIGSEDWVVTTFDDPATGVVTDDMRKVTVRIIWRVGGLHDTVSVYQLLPKP